MKGQLQDDVRPEQHGPVTPEPPRQRRRLVLFVGAMILVVAGTVWLWGQARPTVSQSFDGPDGTWVDSEDFWDEPDRGLARNETWFAIDGALEMRSGQAHTDDDRFRMYTRRTDLQNPSVSFDLTFHGFSGGSEDWRGINVWLNRTVCTPVPECDGVDDPEGNSGYMLRFFAADGHAVVNKKIAGDTREDLSEHATSYVQGGTYYYMDEVAWEPEEGRTYRFEGRVEDNGDGTSTIEMAVDGEVLLRVVDDGSIGGPPLMGGRVGVRSDYADISIDDLEIRA